MRNRKEVVMEGKDDLVSSLKCYLKRKEPFSAVRLT